VGEVLEPVLTQIAQAHPLYVIVSNSKTPRLPPWGEDHSLLAA